MATGRLCPLTDNKELCDQVVTLGRAVPGLVETVNSMGLTLARIEEKVGALPEIARGQQEAAQRLAALEEHLRGAESRISTLEKRQEDSQRFLVSAMFAAVMGFVTGILGLVLREVHWIATGGK
jgi:chromosome segregation ATPase